MTNFLMKTRFTKLSKKDYSKGIDYYAKESNDLANRFKTDVKQAFKRIETFPNLYPKINEQIQKCILSKFPYTVYYIIKNEIIYILAIANHYENPENFIDRFE